MAKKINQSVLTQADKIINERSEEKERMYGPFSEGMRRAAMIATGMTGKEFTGTFFLRARILRHIRMYGCTKVESSFIRIQTR